MSGMHLEVPFVQADSGEAKRLIEEGSSKDREEIDTLITGIEGWL